MPIPILREYAHAFLTWICPCSSHVNMPMFLLWEYAHVPLMWICSCPSYVDMPMFLSREYAHASFTWICPCPCFSYLNMPMPLLREYAYVPLTWICPCVMDTIFWLSPSIESCNWIDFISVAYASWYHWNCGRTQRKAATINQFACPSYSLYVQLLWHPMYYPGGMNSRVSPLQ